MSIPAIRKDIPMPQSRIEHHGLFFSRFLSSHEEKDDPPAPDKLQSLARHALKTSGLALPEIYPVMFNRWKRLQATEPNQLQDQVTVRATSPIAIGLGNAHPSENGLTLHHTYGVPIIPGSALKGLTRRALQRVLGTDGKMVVDTLLGDSCTEGSKFEGAITFYDAWFIPENSHQKPLHPDTITVHHHKYYGSEGKEAAPTDFDDPNPIPLLVIKPGVSFLLTLSIDIAVGEYAQQGLKLVQEALLWALANEGIGAKTNAGYGRLRGETSTGGTSVVTVVPVAPGRELALAQIDLVGSIRQGSPNNVEPFQAAFDAVKEKPEIEQRPIAEAIFKKVNAAGYGKYQKTEWFLFAQRLGKPQGRR